LISESNTVSVRVQTLMCFTVLQSLSDCRARDFQSYILYFYCTH